MLSDFGIFALVALPILMPVHAVNFESYAMLRQEKINRISAHAMFLNVWDGKRIESLADLFLDLIFARESSVARKAAEFAFVAGCIAKLFTTVLALLDKWRAAAFFAAILAVEVFFCAKLFAASLARHVLGLSRPACVATDSVAIGNGCGYRKLFAAFGARLDGYLRGTRFFEAFSTAVCAVLSILSVRQRLAAMSAHLDRSIDDSRFMVAMATAVHLGAVLWLKFLAALLALLGHKKPPIGVDRMLAEGTRMPIGGKDSISFRAIPINKRVPSAPVIITRLVWSNNV